MGATRAGEREREREGVSKLAAGDRALAPASAALRLAAAGRRPSPSRRGLLRRLTPTCALSVRPPRGCHALLSQRSSSFRSGAASPRCSCAAPQPLARRSCAADVPLARRSRVVTCARKGGIRTVNEAGRLMASRARAVGPNSARSARAPTTRFARTSAIRLGCASFASLEPMRPSFFRPPQHPKVEHGNRSTTLRPTSSHEHRSCLPNTAPPPWQGSRICFWRRPLRGCGRVHFARSLDSAIVGALTPPGGPRPEASCT